MHIVQCQLVLLFVQRDQLMRRRLQNVHVSLSQYGLGDEEIDPIFHIQLLAETQYLLVQIRYELDIATEQFHSRQNVRVDLNALRIAFHQVVRVLERHVIFVGILNFGAPEQRDEPYELIAGERADFGVDHGFEAANFDAYCECEAEQRDQVIHSIA